MITVSVGSEYKAPGNRTFEVVERKGLGHPDTMSDLVAEEFSYLYSHYCLESFGQVLNHAVDKVTLVGASTKVRFGGFDIIEPATALLIGRIAPAVGSVRIPIYDLFHEAVERVFGLCLVDDRLLPHTNLVIHNTFSSALDRSPNFYQPESTDEARLIGRKERGSNDTVFCTGAAASSALEQLVLDLELLVTAPVNRCRRSAIGTDVKVMALRHGSQVDITVCVPVEPSSTPDRQSYVDAVAKVKNELQSVLMVSPFPDAHLTVNSKDQEGGVYLAPFGTSLGKSDCGAVGRGNRREGYISAFRPSNIEAPGGKNPLHHAGKIYTIAAQKVADRIADEYAVNNAATIIARNGDPLNHPTYVNIDLEAMCVSEVDVRRAATDVLDDVDKITEEFLAADPVTMERDTANKRHTALLEFSVR
jgi:S-adenosylmethionine synthetase